jgi:hypothetical protein
MQVEDSIQCLQRLAGVFCLETEFELNMNEMCYIVAILSVSKGQVVLMLN